MIWEKKMEPFVFICTLVASLMSALMIYSNYNTIKSVFTGLKALKTMKYFIISGTKNKIGF